MRKAAAVFRITGAFAIVLTTLYASAQDTAFSIRSVEFWSDGTRLAGDLFVPSGLESGEKRAAVLLCHGWGGLKSQLNATTAPKLAEAGFVVMTFDYRGWGESDARLVVTDAFPEADEDGMVTVRAQAIRELVDPFDQTEDIGNAITFLEGEPHVDSDRIGLWGTSMGGGHVVWMAAHDARVKCIFAQAASMDAASGVRAFFAGGEAGAREDYRKRVRGELPPVPQRVHQVPGLRGTPYVARFLDYVPADHAHRITVPVMVLDAENEELFDINDHGVRVYEAVKDRVPAEYVLIPDITHYGVYREAFQECTQHAIDWFKTHLKLPY